MGVLGVNTLYRLFCYFKLFSMVGKGLTALSTTYGILTCNNRRYLVCVPASTQGQIAPNCIAKNYVILFSQ